MFQIDKTYQGWSWERFSRHFMYWFGWLMFYSIANSSYHEITLFDWMNLEMMIMCIKLPFTYFVMYYLVPKFLLPKKYLAFFTSFLISVIGGGIAIQALYFYHLNPTYFNYQGEYFWSPKIAFKVLDLIYIISIPTVYKMYQRQSLQEKRALQLVEQKLGAELKVLKNQLHPHFLFNTLNNLYSMVLTKHPQAADVVIRLSDMMSYMLYECERNAIDLEKEIENLKNYIELEKIRYGKRLKISFETGGELAGKSIAPLLLLPFVENAFKHGVEKNELTSWVKINLQGNENQLLFRIENSLPVGESLDQTPNIQSGVGLVNVKKRLELLYPENHRLEIIHEDTFAIDLTLQLP